MERTYFDICFDVIRSRGEGKFFCLNPAQRATEKILTKYNVAHSSKTTSEMDVTDAQSFFRAFPPTLPGDFSCLNPAQRAAEKILTKYNVGRWLENDLEEGPDGMHKEKAPDIV